MGPQKIQSQFFVGIISKDKQLFASLSLSFSFFLIENFLTLDLDFVFWVLLSSERMTDDMVKCGVCGQRLLMLSFFEHQDTCVENKKERLISSLRLQPFAEIFSLPPGRRSDADAHQIVPGLWLGCSSAASDAVLLQHAGIKFVINCASEIPPLAPASRHSLGISHYLHLPLDDDSSRDYTTEFLSGIDYLHSLELIDSSSSPSIDSSSSPIPSGAALVHCAAGVSRSATVVLGYLMRHRGMSLLQALLLVKRARPAVCPNLGFFRYLRALEASRSLPPSLPMVALRLHEEQLSVIPETDPLTSAEQADWDQFIRFQ